MKKMGVGSLAMALLIIMTIFMCVATGSQHEELEKDGLRLPSQGEVGSRKPWSCCDWCACTTSSNPPWCTCHDRLPLKCHPNCKRCEHLPIRPFVVCRDVINEYCGDRCNPEQLLE